MPINTQNVDCHMHFFWLELSGEEVIFNSKLYGLWEIGKSFYFNMYSVDVIVFYQAIRLSNCVGRL